MKIQEAKNGAAQLSQDKHFLMVNKFRINRGENTGQPIYVININELVSNYDKNKPATFQEIKSFLLSQKEYDAWIALLIQLSERKLPEPKSES